MSPNYDFIRHSIDVLRDLLMADNLSKLRSEDLIISALAMSAVDLLLRLVSSMAVLVAVFFAPILTDSSVSCGK